MSQEQLDLFDLYLKDLRRGQTVIFAEFDHKDSRPVRERFHDFVDYCFGFEDLTVSFVLASRPNTLTVKSARAATKAKAVSDDPDVKEALAAVEELERLIEEDVPDWAKEKAPDFFEDVLEKAKEVAETIEQRGEVTLKQQRAISGWTAGVSKWIK